MLCICFTQESSDTDDKMAQEQNDLLFSVDDIPAPPACALRRATANVSHPPEDSSANGNAPTVKYGRGSECTCQHTLWFAPQR